MEKIRALVSHWASLGSEFSNDHLKLCFLWYDEVIIETIVPNEKGFFFSKYIDQSSFSKKELMVFTDIVLPLEERVPKNLLKDFYKSKEPGYPRWGKNCENYTYPNPMNAHQYAHNALIAHIQNEWGIKKTDRHNVEHVEGAARVAVESVRLWDSINKDIPCMLQANNNEKIAMVAARRFNYNDTVEVEPFKLFERIVPSLATVPWGDIIRLKEKGDFDNLRKKVAEVISGSSCDINDAQHELSRLEEKATSEIIEKYRPNVNKITIESAISNIPCIPILNPVSAFFGARDIREEFRKAEELNWFYLLRDIKKLITQE